MYRGFISVFLITFAIQVYEFASLHFLFSYRKQTKYINKRIFEVIKKN
jgi:hypothetical protein